jgi:hypothetical protein
MIVAESRCLVGHRPGADDELEVSPAVSRAWETREVCPTYLVEAARSPSTGRCRMLGGACRREISEVARQVLPPAVEWFLPKSPGSHPTGGCCQAGWR